MIIICQILFVIAAFVSGFFAASILKKVKITDSDKRTQDKHPGNPKQELPKELANTRTTEIDQEYKKLQDILEEEKRIRQDIFNRNLPRKLIRLTRHIERLENQLEQYRKRKNQIESDLQNLNPQIKTYELLVEEISTLSKDIEKVELSKTKLKKALTGIEIWIGEQFTTGNPELAQRMRERSRKRQESK